MLAVKCEPPFTAHKRNPDASPTTLFDLNIEGERYEVTVINNYLRNIKAFFFSTLGKESTVT